MKGLIFLFLMLLSVISGISALAGSSSEHTLTILIIGKVTAYVYISNSSYPIVVTHNETITFNGTATVEFVTNRVYWLFINGMLYFSNKYTVTVNTSETIFVKAVPVLVPFAITLLNQGTLRILYGGINATTDRYWQSPVPWNCSVTLESSTPFVLSEDNMWYGAVANYLEFTPGNETAIKYLNIHAFFVIFIYFVSNVTELKHIYTTSPEGFVRLIFIKGNGTLMLATNETLDLEVPTNNSFTIGSEVNAFTAFIANSSTCYVASQGTNVTIYSAVPFIVNGTKALNLTKPVNVFGHEEYFAYTFKVNGNMTLVITFPQNKTTTTSTTTTTTPSSTSTTSTTSSTTTIVTTSTSTSSTTSISTTSTSSSSTPTTSKSANYTLYIAIAVVVIVVVAVAFLLLRRK